MKLLNAAWSCLYLHCAFLLQSGPLGILTHSILTEVASKACSQAAKKQWCVWLRQTVCSSESSKAVVTFTDSLHWQDSAVLGVCADRFLLSSACMAWARSLRGSRAKTLGDRQSVGSGCSHLEWQYLAHCSSGSPLIPGVPISHISFHRQFGISLSLMLQNSVFPPGSNEGNSFVLGFWDYFNPFDPFKVECLIPTCSDRILYLLPVQELHFIFVLQMRAWGDTGFCVHCWIQHHLVEITWRVS